MSSRGPLSSASDRKPRALLGFMGSGKTLVGALVAQGAGAEFFDLDHLVEDQAGMSIAEIFATHSEAAFRAFEKQTLTVSNGAAYRASGTPVLADACQRRAPSR